ncbi:phosphate ABC transporter substrate-binding/OmpA family protein [Kordiimonas marina]|uniref:phosphate ABC transporter substrate-binding/OmpA family protein n=1 Tax=Kordiimonas marina TaxID=2872312 RepID=UPI001FF10860|nr:phosphate ABC transporter substrate-binding/OmpA family protein [Kordiimonas marina]MCJ9430068.1 OmpA family protein [Kordiimonas marina]
MTRTAKGALALLILGLTLIVGYFLFSEKQAEDEQVASSDAAQSKGVIRVGVDNFTGYFPLCSPMMKSLMLSDGYRLECVEDKADYNDRFARLAAGKLDYAVGTVDAYLLMGAPHRYPGVIVSVLDESKGADAIVARASVIKNMSDFKSKPDVKVAFTPDSPSDHLLKVASVHFDIDAVKDRKGSWRVETDGSAAALKALLDHKADVAVLWEPDVSKALAEPGIVKILGTEQTDRLIVDVLIAGHQVETDTPERTETLLANYFRTLKHYRDHPDEFDAQLATYGGVSVKQAEILRAGIKWISLNENAAEWMGGVRLAGRPVQNGLYEAIDRTLDIQRDVGDFTTNPLPEGDPRRIISSREVSNLFNHGIRAGFTGSPSIGSTTPEAGTQDFPPLSAAAWDKLQDVGNLKVRPIQFESGTAVLTRTGKEQVDEIANVLKTYPNFRFVIQGHTSARGDAQINHTLSQERAEAVKRYLNITYNFDTDRMRAVGFGGDRPLPRRPGESTRAYRARLPRVEIQLVSEAF